MSQYVCTAKNGAEIYEGDIVEDECGGVHQVEYSPEDFGFFTTQLLGSTPIYESPEWITKQCVRVLGNIWDNNLKDFIKEEEE